MSVATAPARGLTAASGWVSRFDMFAGTRRRVVMHGEVLDLALHTEADGSVHALPMPAWLCRRLVERHGFTRVVFYDHGSAPRVMAWGETPLPEAQHELDNHLQGRRDSSDPAAVLPVLAQLLRHAVRVAVILEYAENRFDQPGVEQVLLRKLARETPGEDPPTGLAIHLYPSENQVPRDFASGDPDTALVPVPVANYAERLAYLKRLPDAAPLLRLLDNGAEAGRESLARATEGMRLRELCQLAGLAARTTDEASLRGLLSLFRHGRSYDYWAEHRIERVRERLRDRIHGQDEAIEQVVAVLYAAKQHVGDMIDPGSRQPAAMLFFVGPTGVGKTLLARSLAEALTGSEENLKRLDMAEYAQEHSVQRLIGSPPSYVGYQEGGQLTNWVQLHPYSVVLFDELEKGHPRLMDIHLQILDGARLTSGMGQTVDFSDTVVIYTSNIGTADESQASLKPGERGAVENYYRDQIERHFQRQLGRTEIFGRLKAGIVVFNHITEPVARACIERRLREIAAEAARRRPELSIIFDPASAQGRRVVDELLARTNFVRYGLRDMNNVLKERLGGELARLLDSRDVEGEWRLEWDAEVGVVRILPGR